MAGYAKMLPSVLSHIPDVGIPPQPCGVPACSWLAPQRRDMDLREIGPGLTQAFPHAGESELWCVVGAAQVGQPEPAQPIATPGTQNSLGGLGIGEMSGWTENALLEVIGIGTAQ